MFRSTRVLISIGGRVRVCLWKSYWFNFPLYVTVNECYLNKATEAHKSACDEIVDLVKDLIFVEQELMSCDRDGSWKENPSTPLSLSCGIFKV